MSKPSDVSRRTAIRVAIAGAAAVATGAARAPRQAAGDMERVQGIGGFFFRAKDPKTLTAWYEANLGVGSVPDKYGAQPWRTGAGTTAFQPFKEDTSVLWGPAVAVDDQLPRPRPRQDGGPASRPRHHGRSGQGGLPEWTLREAVRSRRQPDPTLATRRQGSRLRAARPKNPAGRPSDRRAWHGARERSRRPSRRRREAP